MNATGPTCLLFQGDCVAGGDDRNAERAAALVRAHPDAALAVFPELFLTGYSDGLRRDPDERTARAVETLAAAARDAGTAVIAGLPGRVAAGRTSAAVCVDERGETVATCHKQVLFRPERASLVGVPGPPCLVDLAGERVGVMVCFDMEFPEIARRLALGGATLLVTVAANPRPYHGNHRLHARARALENRLPHVYVNRVGQEDDGLSFSGGSCVVDRDGEVVAELGPDGEGVLVSQLLPPLPAADDELDYVAVARTLAFPDAGRPPRPRPRPGPRPAGGTVSNELRDAADIVAETRRLLAAARDAGVPLRALGGAAIALTCPSAHRPPLRRSYGDIDLIAGSRDRAAIVATFEMAGLSPDTGFNALHGADRVWFWEPVRGYKVEVFLDRVSMCHTLELADRIELGDAALAPADLLLLKLQVVAMTDKDLQDAIALLCDHEVGPEGIDADYVGELLASDWGWWRTATETLDKIARRIAEIAADAPPDVPGLTAAAERAETLRAAIEGRSKSRRWRLRARVGERMRWYEEPEEVAG